MRDEFTNRLAMFQTALGTLNSPQHKPAWYDKPPAIFTAMSKEIADYEAVLTAPQQSIANRKSLTIQLRPRFNAVEAKFEPLDRLILRFDRTEPGRALIAAYQASLIIRDLGHGPSTPQPPGAQSVQA